MHKIYERLNKVNKMKNAKEIATKAACITGTVLVGITDALIITPVVKPVLQLVHTGKNVCKIAKAENIKEAVDDIIFDDYRVAIVDQEVES